MIHGRPFRISGVIFLLVLMGACATDRYDLSIEGHQFTVELADTPELRQRGLMDRRTLDPMAGMLFVFPESALRSFWMKDTLIPLSIAYIDERLTIREIHDMEPLSLVPVPSRFPAMFALEVNQGVFEQLGIGPGDRLRPSPALARRLSDAPSM